MFVSGLMLVNVAGLAVSTSSAMAVPAPAVMTAAASNATASAPSPTTSAATSTSHQVCVVRMRGTTCSPPPIAVKPESVLYTTLEHNPQSIASLQLQPATATVVVTLKGKSQYIVDVTDGVDIDHIRTLALNAKPSIPFAASAASSTGGGSIFPLLGVFLLIGFVVIVTVLYRLGKSKKTDNQQPGRMGGGQMSSPIGTGKAGKKDGGSGAASKPQKVITFADVIGAEQAKAPCMDLVFWLTHDHILEAVGGVQSLGVILAGPEGTGKTLLARAVAGEAGVPFFPLAGSEFIEENVGVGARRMRDAFAKARSHGRAIIFIDEIDSFAKKRSGRNNHSENANTLNQLLTEMQGFEDSNIIVMAASNLIADLDPALLRRFNERIQLTLPKLPDRVKLFEFYLKGKPVEAGLDLDIFAKKSAGMNGSAIMNICNRAALVLGRTVGEMSDKMAVEQLHHGAEPVTKPPSFKAKFHFNADKRAQEKLKTAAAERAATPEARLEVSKRRIANQLIADGMRITSQMILDAIAQEIKTQAKKSDGNRYQSLGDPVLFSHVKGQVEAKEELAEVVDILRNPHKYPTSKIPKGVLLSGPPGEGKTMMARAVAGEADVPFFSIAASSLDSGEIGSGSSRIQALFGEAKACAPSIIFIDEVDAVARKRGSSHAAEYYTQTLNQLISEMDGFEQGEDPVIVIVATNNPEGLDPAFVRAGRIDRKISLYKPDLKVRIELLEHYMRDRSLEADVNLEFFAATTAGFSASALANVCNESELLQKRMNREAGLPSDADVTISGEAINNAVTREMMGGAQRKSRVMSQIEKYNVAVHEAGHAGVHHVVSDGDLIARITIMPWGDSGGHVQPLDKDEHMPPRQSLIDRICICLGGRVAQEVVMDRVDVGASNDFIQAKQVAYMMVTDYGMSPLGPQSALQGVERSELQKQAIEAEVDKILAECREIVHAIVIANRHRIDRVVEVLLEQETILGPAFKELWECSSTAETITPSDATGADTAPAEFEVAIASAQSSASVSTGADQLSLSPQTVKSGSRLVRGGAAVGKRVGSVRQSVKNRRTKKAAEGEVKAPASA